MSRVAAAFKRAGIDLSVARRPLDQTTRPLAFENTPEEGAADENAADEPEPWKLDARETPRPSAALLQDPWHLESGAHSLPQTVADGPAQARQATPEPSAAPAVNGQSRPANVPDGAVLDPPFVGPDVGPVAREQYRKLGAALHEAQREHRIEVVMITSALPAEGKTLTATNLARTLSASYCRNVLLIDADYRRPSLHGVFGIPPSARPKDALTRSAMSCVVRVRPGLWVLPAEQVDGDPLNAVVSERMRQAIADGRAMFDWVIVDTPPVGLLADANILGSMADAVLMVVAAGKTPLDHIRRTADALRGHRFVAVVLNQVDPAQLDAGGDYYAAYPDVSTAS